MLVLALDTATAATAVALVAFDQQPDQVQPAARRLAGRRHVDPRAHGEQLGPQIRAVLAEAGHAPADLTAIVAGTGPGPFTGLRVGLATAAAMAQALGIPSYGVCSLDAVADPAPEPVLVATDARRREIYWAVYQYGRRLTGPAVDRPAQVPAAAAAYHPRRAYGEGALRYRDLLGLPVSETGLYPDPFALAVAAQPRSEAGAPGEPLVPRYLRRPDAVTSAAAGRPVP